MRETHWVRQNPLHFWQRSNYCTIRVPTKITSQTSDIFFKTETPYRSEQLQIFSPSYRLG